MDFHKRHDKKVVFVTGGAGRFGRQLVSQLVAAGYNVRVLVESSEKVINYLPTGVVPFIGKLDDKKVLSSACKGADVVVHLAAITSEYKYTTSEVMKTNVEGTANLLDACRQAGVEHFIYTSTVDVYGRRRVERLVEDVELKPTDKYGYSKMLAEHEIIKYQDRLYFTIFRLATLYGPGFETAYYKVFKAVKEQKAYIIGSGDNHLSMLHVKDAIAGIMLAIENPESRGRIYNISDGISYTQSYLLELSAELLGVPKPTKHINPFIVNLLAKSRGLDSDELRFLTSNRRIVIDRIREELKYKPTINIKKGGSDLVKSFMRRYRPDEVKA